MPVSYSGDLFFLVLPVVVHKGDDMYGVLDDNVEMILVEFRSGICAPPDDWPWKRPGIVIAAVYQEFFVRLKQNSEMCETGFDYFGFVTDRNCTNGRKRAYHEGQVDGRYWPRRQNGKFRWNLSLLPGSGLVGL